MDRARRIAEMLDRQLATLQKHLIADEFFYALLVENDVLPSRVVDNIRVRLTIVTVLTGACV
jgi:hypothetical protein